MNAFAAQLFGPGLPKAGQPVQARFVGAHLVVEGERRLDVASSQITAAAGGFDHDGLFLNWVDSTGSWALTPTDAAARHRLLTSAPATLNPQLARWQRTRNGLRAKWSALAAVAGLLLALGGLLWWQYDAALDWVARQVPPKTERRLGEAALSQLRSDGGLTSEGAAVDFLRDTGARLVPESPYEYQWHVKDDSSINAFALPGGIIVVHSGLIEKAASAEEVAGVLAHEVQHVERRHILKNLINSAGWAALLTVTLGDVSALTAVLIHQAGSLSFGRDLEREADEHGVKALVAAGISPNGMVGFFRKIQTESGGEGSEALAMLSSHPATAERIATIEQLIAANPCPSCQPLKADWAAVQAAVK